MAPETIVLVTITTVTAVMSVLIFTMFRAARLNRHRGYLAALQNKTKVEQQRPSLTTSAAVPDAVLQVVEKRKWTPSSSLAGPIYGLNFNDEDAVPDEDVEWIDPRDTTRKSSSSLDHVSNTHAMMMENMYECLDKAPVPKTQQNFVQGAAETDCTLQAALQYVADKHGIPAEELVVYFDEWPFGDKIPIRHARYDATGLPCHTFYSVEIQELFRPDPVPEPEPEPEAPPEDKPLKLIHLRELPSQPRVKNKLHQLVATGAARAKLPEMTTKQVTEDFLRHTYIRQAPGKSPPVAVSSGSIVRFTFENTQLDHYFTTRDWLHGADKQVESLVRSGALIMTPNYIEFSDDPEFDV